MRDIATYEANASDSADLRNSFR